MDLDEKDKEVLRAWQKKLDLAEEIEETHGHGGPSRDLWNRYLDACSEFHSLIYDHTGNFRDSLRHLLDGAGLDRDLLEELDNE